MNSIPKWMMALLELYLQYPVFFIGMALAWFAWRLLAEIDGKPIPERFFVPHHSLSRSPSSTPQGEWNPLQFLAEVFRAWNPSGIEPGAGFRGRTKFQSRSRPQFGSAPRKERRRRPRPHSNGKGPRPKVPRPRPIPTPSHIVLGVSPQADTHEIHQAFRRMVMKHHPDRLAGESTTRIRQAQEQTVLILRAKETLLKNRQN